VVEESGAPPGRTSDINLEPHTAIEGVNKLPKKDSRYWDSVARHWQTATPRTLWRAYNDAINTAVFSQWLPKDSVEYLLKTDLFDESLGDGLYPLLSAHAKSLYGIDVSILTAQAAKLRHNGLCVTEADVRRLPFANGVFEVIVSNSTLDHFESSDGIAAGLNELHRVLRPGGQLLLTLDNFANPAIALRNMLPFRVLNRVNLVPYYMGVTLSPERLRKHLEHAGFNVLETRAVMHFPRVLTMAMAHIFSSHTGLKTESHLISLLMSFEHLSKLPSRFITGYYVAVRAIRPS
jgi:SAM-dependent methyltransferase